jgi:hypothetical protein
VKKLITNYSFNAASKTVTFSDYGSISLENVLLVTNVTANTIIYNFAQVAKGGTVSGNVLTLTYNTTSMSNGDKLQIYYDDPAYAPTQTVQGNVASGAADSGNPVKIGGRYNTTAPTLSDGQRSDVQLNSRSILRVSLTRDSDGGALSASSPGDATSNTQTALINNSFSSVFNGTTWDRTRSATVASGTTGTGLLGTGVLGYDGTNYQRLKTDANGVLATSQSDGTTTGNNIIGDAGQNAQLVAGSRKEVSFTTTTVQAVAATDVSNYAWVSVHVTSNGTSSVVNFQTSNDNVNWVSSGLVNSASTFAPMGVSASATGVYHGPLSGRYFRLNITGISAGTTAGIIEFLSVPKALTTMGVSATSTQSGTWTVGSNAATGSAIPANAFYLGGRGVSGNLEGLYTNSSIGDGQTANILGTTQSIYNGTNFDRTRSATAASGTTGTGLLGAGGLALGKTANPTAVTDGQYVVNLADKLGKQIVAGSIRELKGIQQTTITSSTSETTIVTAVASTFLDVYGLIITNTSATPTKVTIKDATAGTTRAVYFVPANDTRGMMLPESGAMPQAAVNNNWTATCGTSVASIEITALYVKNI